MCPKILKTLIVISLTTCSFSVHADGGISGSGGGNSVNRKLVEDLALDFSNAKGNRELEAKIQMLERELPVFGKEVRDHFQRLTFYVVPRKLKELPPSQTGLDFKNEQVALQKENEVFINGEIYRQWGPEEAAKLYLHEALMNMTEAKRSPDVRKVVAKIFSSGASPEAIQRSLVNNHFGANLTRNQLVQLKEMQRRNYLDRIIASSEISEGACSNGGSIEEILNDLNKSDIGSVYCDPKTDSNRCEEFRSPFRLYEDAAMLGFAMSNPWGFERSRVDLVRQSLNLTKPAAHTDVLHELDLPGWERPNVERKLRQRSLERNVFDADFNFQNNGKIFQQLASRPSYSNVLAIEAIVNKRFATQRMKNDIRADFRSSMHSYIRKIHSNVYGRSKNLADYSPEQLRSMLCSSISSIKKELTRMRDGKSAPISTVEKTASDPKEGGAIDAR